MIVFSDFKFWQNFYNDIVFKSLISKAITVY